MTNITQLPPRPKPKFECPLCHAALPDVWPQITVPVDPPVRVVHLVIAFECLSCKRVLHLTHNGEKPPREPAPVVSIEHAKKK